VDEDDTPTGDNKKRTLRSSPQGAQQSPVSSPGSATGIPSPSSSLFQPSFQMNGKISHYMRRRQKKRTNATARRKELSILLLGLMAVGGSSLWFVRQASSTKANAVADFGSRRATVSAGDDDSMFQLYSMDAPASCSSTLDEADVDFTLVTQVSTDRIWMMEHHCRRWQFANETFYPMSVAVLTNETTQEIQRQLQEMGCDVENIVTVQTLQASLFPEDDYPINRLRNMALSAVKTSHVVYIDVDFWINRDLSAILQFPEVRRQLAEDPKSTLVIPAFQLARQCPEWRECPDENIPEMPQNLLDMKRQILSHQVTRFDPTNRGGHGSTRYKDWFKQNRVDGKVLIEIDCFLSNRYEPYLVFRYCRELPPFQEPFSGYGKNKMTWVMQLRRMGYRFWQLGKGAFVIHYPHLDSPSRMAWNNAPDKRNDPTVKWQAYKRGQMDHLFVHFRKWLQEKVPDLTRTFFCEDKLNDDARLWYDRKAFNRSISLRS